MKARKFEFTIPIYNCITTVIVCDNFVKHAKKLGEDLELSANDSIGFAFKLNGGSSNYVMLIKKERVTDWSTVAHEALHIANFTLEDRGIKCSVKNDEAQAYLLSYILEQYQTEVESW